MIADDRLAIVYIVPVLYWQLLQREYGDYIVDAESGYDFSIQIEYDKLPANKGSVCMYVCVLD